MSEGKTIYAALLAVQQDITAPKDKQGYGYEYRTADGILQAAKPLLRTHGVICTLSDESKQVGNRYYIRSTATLIDIATGDSISATGEAVEPDKLASMAPPQITGTASTYARKRALEGLFLLDNEKDVDSKEVQDAIQKSQNKAGATNPQQAIPNKGNTQKTSQGQTDAVRAQAIKRLNEVIAGKGVAHGFMVSTAKKVVGKSSVADMTADEIVKVAEALEFDQ